ncbi:hypothetical protein MD484_g2716, partial [Candolleomyces efflorescens]
MPIDYPAYFFRLIRPRAVEAKFRAAINDPAIIAAVGVEDPQMIVEYLRDNTEDDELWMAACKLFPLPEQHELLGFQLDPAVPHIGYLVIPGAIVDLGAPNVNMDDSRGMLTWVRTYREMVHDWCAEHRAARLAERDRLQ